MSRYRSTPSFLRSAVARFCASILGSKELERQQWVPADHEVGSSGHVEVNCLFTNVWNMQFGLA